MGTTRLLKDIATINFGILLKSEKISGGVQWITTANLLPDNTLTGYEQGLCFQPTESLSVKNGDVLIRRVAPTYVNYIKECAPNCYAGNNLIIVRATERVHPMYLAYYLNNNIERIIKKAAKGTVLPTLARQDLGEFEIILPNNRIQHLVGNLWFLHVEKIKLEEKLRDLEIRKLHHLLDKCIKNTKEQSNDDA